MSHHTQRIAVIGLGRFGMALCRRLATHGADVIAIDRNGALVAEISDDVDIAVRLDATDEDALRSQEIDRVDAVVVAIGENFEAALLTTVLCRRNLCVSRVICRAQTSLHAEIFSQIGAHEVIQPEQHAGDMLGRRLAQPHILDYIQLAEGFTVIELQAPAEFVGRTVRDIDLRRTWSVNLIAIRRLPPSSVADTSGGTGAAGLISVPGPEDTVQQDDVLVLAGAEDSLAGLSRL